VPVLGSVRLPGKADQPVHRLFGALRLPGKLLRKRKPRERVDDSSRLQHVRRPERGGETIDCPGQIMRMKAGARRKVRGPGDGVVHTSNRRNRQ